jgi:hypothetical protein
MWFLLFAVLLVGSQGQLAYMESDPRTAERIDGCEEGDACPLTKAAQERIREYESQSAWMFLVAMGSLGAFLVQWAHAIFPFASAFARSTAGSFFSRQRIR